MFRKIFIAAFLVMCASSAHATTYTINHAVCINGTATTNVVLKDCGGIPALASNNLSDIVSASTARTNLGLVISTNVAPATSGSLALLGNGAGGFSNYSGGSCTNQFIRSLSTAIAITCATVSLTADVTGTLVVANGGTGITSYAVGDLLYASGSTTLSKLADVAVGRTLVSGGVGVAPSWSVSLRLGGTSSPSDTNLNVFGTYTSSLAPAGMHIKGDVPGFSLEDSVGTGSHRNFALLNGAQCAGCLSFQYSASAGANPDSVIMTLDAVNGRLGILINPSYQLDVAGGINGYNYNVNSHAGVDCTAGTLNLVTAVVEKGIITHC